MTSFPIPIDETGNPWSPIDKLEDETSFNFVGFVLINQAQMNHLYIFEYLLIS